MFDVGQEVWVYQCPESPKRGIIQCAVNDGDYAIKLHGQDNTVFYHPHSIFKYPSDKKFLIASIQVDMTYLQRYVDNLV